MSELNNIKPCEAYTGDGNTSPRLCGHPRFYEIVEEMKRIHSAKNQDYAKKEDPLDNLKQCEKIGIPAHIGCFIRMQDKMSRATNLIGGQSGNKSLRDALSLVAELLRVYGAQEQAQQLDALILLLWGKKQEAQVKDESINDTLTDLAVYSVLCRVLWEERS